MYELAAFRGVQGLGAGGLFSLALTIIGDIVAAPGARPLPGLLPRRLRHRRASSARSSAASSPGRTSSSASPAGAGSSWSTSRSASSRSSWWPGCCTCRTPRREHRIDWPGALALAVGARAAADRRRAGPRSGAGTRRRSLACYVVGIGRRSCCSCWPSAGSATTRCCRCACSATAPSSVGSLLNFIVGMGMFGGARPAAAVPADRQGLDARRTPACRCCRWCWASWRLDLVGPVHLRAPAATWSSRSSGRR